MFFQRALWIPYIGKDRKDFPLTLILNTYGLYSKLTGQHQTFKVIYYYATQA